MMQVDFMLRSQSTLNRRYVLKQAPFALGKLEGFLSLWKILRAVDELKFDYSGSKSDYEKEKMKILW